MQIALTEHAVQVIEFSGLRDSSFTSLNEKQDTNYTKDTKTIISSPTPEPPTPEPEPESEPEDCDDSEPEDEDELEDVPDVPEEEFVASALAAPAASAPVVSANVVTANVTRSDPQLPQLTEDNKRPKDIISDPNIHLSQPDREDASSDKQTNLGLHQELLSQAVGDSDKQTNPCLHQELLAQVSGDSNKQTNPGQQWERLSQASGASDKQPNQGQHRELLLCQATGDSNKQTNPGQQWERLAKWQRLSQASGASDKQTSPEQQWERLSQASGASGQRRELLLQATGDSNKQTNPEQQWERLSQASGASDKQTNRGQQWERLSQASGASDKQTNHGQRRELLLQATGDARLTKEEILPKSSFHLMQQQQVESPNSMSTGHSQPLFVSTNIGDPRLTIEDIYTEAMRLSAEIRIHRHQLDNSGHAELKRILDFCHDALHEKLVINSRAKRVHGATEEREEMLA